MNEKRRMLFLFLLLVVTVFFYSVFVRYNQYSEWKKNKDLYFVENYPAMTTLDAYYWLRYAKEHDRGVYYKSDNDTLRYYPDSQKRPKPVPMLSFLVAKFSSFTGGNYYYAGLFLIPILASLFIIPFSVYFYFAGFPFAGLVGSFVGTFSYMYFVRSSIGRVDTDLLNIFFPALASLFIYLAGKTENDKKTYIFVALSGFTMFLFYWWYYHPGFTLIYFVVLIALLFVYKKQRKVIIYSAIIYFIFSNPIYFFYGIFNLFGFIKNYFTISKENVIGFPNILQTITEAQQKPIEEVLKYVMTSPALTVIGLILFLIVGILNWKRFFAVVPLFLLGLLSFKSSNRFSMFLAPFAGAGLGVLIDYFYKIGSEKFKDKKQYVGIGVLSLFVFMTMFVQNLTAISYVPKPSINSNIIKSFIDMNKKLPQGAIWSWWDYGYAIEDIVGFPVYHDGGSQGSPKTYFVAKSFITDNQSKLYKYVSYFDNYGMEEIKKMIEDNISALEIVKKVDSFDGKPVRENNYLLYTQDMISKFSAFNFIGSYNFQTKQPEKVVLALMSCQKMERGLFFCDGNRIDTEKGLVNDRVPLKQFVVTVNGKAVQRKSFPFNKGLNAELVVRDKMIYYLIVGDDKFYNSNFNQMYILGNYDKKLFEEVYNNFPFARVFRVRK
ncbi:hypothetical protein [Deferribacter abyssi]|uniref:hypothetical protein n=1 Tax=Deferribacter abyssi TaxID=213806 RepID=UPI003C1FF745